MSKLTEWISGSKKPVRVGVYQREMTTDSDTSVNGYAYWNGGMWSISYIYQSDAEQEKLHINESYYQPYRDGGLDFNWRGLTTKDGK